MNFESFASRIMDFREFTPAEKQPKKIIQKRFQIKKTNMKTVNVSRNQFGLLNSKRYYLIDGVISYCRQLEKRRSNISKFTKK